MLHVAQVLSVALSAIALAAAGYICLFALLGIARPRAKNSLAEIGPSPRFLVLVPAHNEAHGIAPAIQSILSADYPALLLRVITIADNCADDTAKIAHANGSEVWLRKDPDHPGKGQALQWALDRAEKTFDLAAVIDADTFVDRDFFLAMANASSQDLQHSRPCVYQGRYTFASSSVRGGWFDTFSIASKAAENSFIYRPRSSAGLINLLQGNGFCISRSALARVPFSAHSVVEDAEYAMELAIAGVPVRFVEDARVSARMTETVRDASSQRLRWASGTFQLIFHFVPRLLAASVRNRSWKLAEAALLLLTMSRVLVAGITGLSLVLAIGLLRTSPGMIAFSLSLAALLLEATYLLLVFKKSDKHSFPLAGIFWTPFYLAFVSATQALALTGWRRRRWSRTVR